MCAVTFFFFSFNHFLLHVNLNSDWQQRYAHIIAPQKRHVQEESKNGEISSLRLHFTAKGGQEQSLLEYGSFEESSKIFLLQENIPRELNLWPTFHPQTAPTYWVLHKSKSCPAKYSFNLCGYTVLEHLNHYLCVCGNRGHTDFPICHSLPFQTHKLFISIYFRFIILIINYYYCPLKRLQLQSKKSHCTYYATSYIFEAIKDFFSWIMETKLNI